MSNTEGMRLIPRGMYCGSAFRWMEQLHGWFTPEDLSKLATFAYHIVRFRADKVVVETPTQVVFAQDYPLARLPIYQALRAYAKADG